MEILESCEVFVGRNDDLEFSHTKVILKGDSEYHYAVTHRRFRSIDEIDPSELTCIPMRTSDIWPEFPTSFTRAPEPLLQNLYVKRPSSLSYGDSKTSTEISTLVLHEAQICETLRKCPHPNIAQYLGCVVDGGRITRLFKASEPFDRLSCLKEIRSGIEHLHKLGIIHCDINPHNIYSHGNSWVIGDFDSSTSEGEKLGLKAGTGGWTKDQFKFARRENNLYGLAKIEEFIRTGLEPFCT
ncbi:serine/threonine-protein kinase-like protein [Viridothelium virens]|uniref:Serine/threonine-protein kinase-like protein n=1 Tax=Viridothelium virens TaxID=1048519 RepID=A0A6A6H9B0_VIRVR|nr:serine/threonine-protein kinase-like protein [Viridothelium virens]